MKESRISNARYVVHVTRNKALALSDNSYPIYNFHEDEYGSRSQSRVD